MLDSPAGTRQATLSEYGSREYGGSMKAVDLLTGDATRG